jgi:hypothetical protein
VSTRVKSTHVFINCPFDTGFQPILNAIVFAVYDLGFVARCALEDDDAGEVRLAKIQRIIEECRYGINDLSTVTLDTVTGLPRFNMPLELDLFLGCKRFGAKNQSKKRTLILDSEQLYLSKDFSCNSSNWGGAFRASWSGVQCSAAPNATWNRTMPDSRRGVTRPILNPASIHNRH